MVSLPPWDSRYPNPALLRTEIQTMTWCVLDALLDVVPRTAIRSVTRKGSSCKRWDSLLDYVPEISDVDIHVLLRDEADESRYFGTVEGALAIRNDLERRYREAVPNPIHTPRPQILIANRLHRQEGFVPSPAWTVQTELGEEAAEGELDRAASRESSRQRLLEEEEFVGKLPMTIIDKPEQFLSPVVRVMTWRVGPTGPRVLEVQGASYEEAWGGNRTAVWRLLAERGEQALADDYAAFYLSAWKFFLSAYRDDAALQDTVLAGARVLARGIAVARTAETV